jgi:hypothetical protein
MLAVPCEKLGMPDVPDLIVDYQTVCRGERMLSFQVLQHGILVVKLDYFILIFGMNIFLDASPALGKEITSGRRNIQFLVIIVCRDLDISVRIEVYVIKRVILGCKAGGDVVVYVLLTCSLLLSLPAVIFLIDVENAKDEIVVIFIETADHLKSVPYGLAVDHETVFDALVSALLQSGDKLLLLDILYENMLIFFINDLLAVADDVLEKIIAALLEAQRMELGVYGIPVILIRDSIDIVDT